MNAFEVQCAALRTCADDDQAQHVEVLSRMLLPITPVDRPRLLALTKDLPFEPAHLALLRSRIENLKNGGSTSTQDWTAVHKYLSNDKIREWTDASPEAISWQLLNWVWKLGLRSPSMPTFQCLTALSLFFGNGINSSAVEKKGALDDLKIMWRRLQGDAPGLYIGNLPATPHALRGLVPDQWWFTQFGATFDAIQWVSSDDLQFGSLQQSIPMRSTRCDVRQHYLAKKSYAPAPALATPALTAHDPNTLLSNLLAALVSQSPGQASSASPRVQMLSRSLSTTSVPDVPVASARLPLMPPPMDSAANGLLQAEGDKGVGSAAAARQGGMSLQDTTTALVEHAAAAKAGCKPSGKAGSKPKGKAGPKPKSKAKVGAKPKGKAGPKPKSKAKPGPKPKGKAGPKHTNRKKGCSKCRGKPGCTPSCVALNTKPY
jgi:hypothetical protein